MGGGYGGVDEGHLEDGIQRSIGNVGVDRKDCYSGIGVVEGKWVGS